MTLVFCHYLEDKLILVTDSFIIGHGTPKPKCAAFPGKPVVTAWWGDLDIEPKVLTDDPLLVPPIDKPLATSNSIAAKLPMPDDVWPCFASAFLYALNETDVHNGNRGRGGLLMGVVARKSIHAFVYHVAGGRGSWQLCDRSGVGAWPQLFGDIASLNDMLNVQNPREDLGSLARSRTSGEFVNIAKRWITQTEQFQKAQQREVTVGQPAYRLALTCDGAVEGPNAF